MRAEERSNKPASAGKCEARDAEPEGRRDDGKARRARREKRGPEERDAPKEERTPRGPKRTADRPGKQGPKRRRKTRGDRRRGPQKQNIVDQRGRHREVTGAELAVNIILMGEVVVARVVGRVVQWLGRRGIRTALIAF